LPKEQLRPDLGRRLISTERLMLAHVYLEKGCVVPKHSHENEQLTYILEGTLRFWLGDDEAEMVDVHAGEALHIPPDVPHRAEALDLPGERIGVLQQLLYANSSHAILLLFQGMDASGKDGSVRSVLSHVNPAGVETANFKVPSDEERAHDYLWRVHKVLPRYGNFGVFNRSHYEDVLVVRVHNLVEKSAWKTRYEKINKFERFLTDEGTTILKFFLHISKEKQKERRLHGIRSRKRRVRTTVAK
jgi:quercetin dioxygenase-like cupin family protein